VNILEDITQSLQYASERFLFWQTNKEKLQPILDELEQVVTVTNASVTSHTLDLSATGGKKEFLSLFQILRSHGYSPSYEYEEKWEMAGRFWKKDGQPSIWVFFCSTACKRVQVGTEMKEVPVFEVRCDEDMLPLEALIPTEEDAA
jgi:hypothetical protein